MVKKSTYKTYWFINQYASTPETGIGGRHFYLSKELAKQGNKVFLIAASYTHLLRQPPKLKNKFKFQKITKNFNFLWIKMPKYNNAHDKKRVLNWFNFTWKIFQLPKLIDEKPDVIFFSSPSLIPFLACKHLAKKFNTKLVFEVRDIWPKTLVELGGYSTKNLFIQFLQWIEDKAYFDSDLVISNLPYAVNHMIERGMNPDKFSWIPNGIDKMDIKNIQSLDQKTLSSLPKNKFIIGYTGTLGFANALDTLIDSAILLKKQNDIFFVIVGDGKEKNFLKKKAKKLKNVIFIDSLAKQQIQSILAYFDVCYIGLTKNPLFRFGVSPNKIFDYFLSSKPIIYSIDSGKYLPVDEAKAGISIQAQNPHLISDAILKLKALTPGERKKMGDNGFNYVLKRHNYSKLAKKLANIIHK